MKAYLIDPYNCSITQVKYSGDYNDIYNLIDAKYFDCVGFNEFRDTLYVDDEGLYKDNKEFFMIEGYPQPLVGKALVLGCDRNGNSIAPKISLTKLRNMVSFIPSIFIMEVAPA
jgi:hypothetical protein